MEEHSRVAVYIIYTPKHTQRLLILHFWSSLQTFFGLKTEAFTY